jgi:hypothetical protein
MGLNRTPKYDAFVINFLYLGESLQDRTLELGRNRNYLLSPTTTKEPAAWRHSNILNKRKTAAQMSARRPSEDVRTYFAKALSVTA